MLTIRPNMQTKKSEKGLLPVRAVYILYNRKKCRYLTPSLPAGIFTLRGQSSTTVQAVDRHEGYCVVVARFPGLLRRRSAPLFRCVTVMPNGHGCDYFFPVMHRKLALPLGVRWLQNTDPGHRLGRAGSLNYFAIRASSDVDRQSEKI